MFIIGYFLFAMASPGFVVVDNFDCWLVDASTSHRWKPVAADRVDVPSYILEELIS